MSLPVTDCGGFDLPDPRPMCVAVTVIVQRAGKRTAYARQDIDLGALADCGGDLLRDAGGRLARNAWGKQEADS